MSQSTPSLEQILKDAIESRITDLHTAMIGVVQSYNAQLQTADIQPVIKKKYADGTLVNLPLLANVPILFNRTGKAYLHVPLKKDDYVLLIFCERSLDVWLQQGGIVDPKDYRKHNLSDAIAIAGIFPQGKEIQGQPDKVDLVNDQSKISLSEDGKIKIGKVDGTPEENVPLGLILKQYLEDIHAQYAALIDILIAGDLCLVTSPGNPTAPNPAKTPSLVNIKSALAALKASPISDKAFLSDVLFTEKG